MLLLSSVTFCCVAAINSAYAYQSVYREEFKSIDNINVNTVKDKMQELKQVNTKQLKYADTISQELQMDVYMDQQGNTYTYNEENEMISYAINYSVQNNKTIPKLSQKQALDYGEKYLKEIVEDTSNYSLQEISYNAYNKTYDIIFDHKVCGVKTLDIVYLTIQNDGNLVYYSTPALNVFDTISISSNYKREIKEQIKEQLEDLYENSLVSYKIDDIILAYDNEKFHYNVSVVYTINQNDEDIELGDIVAIDF